MHAELMTDLWNTLSTNTLYPYTKVPLLQPSSSSGGLSQPIIRPVTPTVLITSTDRTSAGVSSFILVGVLAFSVELVDFLAYIRLS